MQETQVPSLGWEDPLREETATHASILAWKIPKTEEPGRLQPRGCKESDTTEDWTAAATDANLCRSCPTLCDPIDGSPPGSTVPGILQARILEWVSISFSNAWKWKVKVKSLSSVRLFAAAIFIVLVLLLPKVLFLLYVKSYIYLTLIFDREKWII